MSDEWRDILHMYMYRHLLIDKRLKNTHTHHHHNNNKRKKKEWQCSLEDRCKCVGVIWLVYHVLNFYRLVLHNKTSKSMMKNLQELDSKSDLRWFGDGYRMCMFADFWTGYTHVLPLAFSVECRVVVNIWRCHPISFEHVFFMMLAHWTTYQSNTRVRWRKRST